MSIKTISVGQLGTNCYIVYDGTDGLVIDPGDNGDKICSAVSELGINISTVVLTHYHFDHVGAVDYVCEKTGAKLAVFNMELDAYKNPPSVFSFAKAPVKAVDMILYEGDCVDAGNLKLKVLHTPGHTEGGITLIGDGYAFCGDTIFYESIGRTDFPGGDFTQIIKSCQKILKLPDSTVLYCGHGPSTTVEHEKMCNPYVSEAVL